MKGKPVTFTVRMAVLYDNGNMKGFETDMDTFEEAIAAVLHFNTHFYEPNATIRTAIRENK
jgi:hypothetical protein